MAALATSPNLSEAEALATLRGSQDGVALSGSLRARMEARTGLDLAGVRIHTEEVAAAVAALGAKAATLGSHVYFGEERFHPGSSEGERLLVHELTHVGQFQRGELVGVGGTSKTSMSAELDAVAAEASMSFGGVGGWGIGEASVAPMSPPGGGFGGSEGPATAPISAPAMLSPLEGAEGPDHLPASRADDPGLSVEEHVEEADAAEVSALIEATLKELEHVGPVDSGEVSGGVEGPPTEEPSAEVKVEGTGTILEDDEIRALTDGLAPTKDYRPPPALVVRIWEAATTSGKEEGQDPMKEQGFSSFVPRDGAREPLDSGIVQGAEGRKDSTGATYYSASLPIGSRGDSRDMKYDEAGSYLDDQEGSLLKCHTHPFMPGEVVDSSVPSSYSEDPRHLGDLKFLNGDPRATVGYVVVEGSAGQRNSSANPPAVQRWVSKQAEKGIHFTMTIRDPIPEGSGKGTRPKDKVRERLENRAEDNSTPIGSPAELKSEVRRITEGLVEAVVYEGVILEGRLVSFQVVGRRDKTSSKGKR